jgi:hypothetical protein
MILYIYIYIYLIFIYLGMITGHRIELKTFRMRKRPKKTSLNAKIIYKPFKNKPIKILPILIFIDNYNYYIKGVDQSNQLRASFITYFFQN